MKQFCKISWALLALLLLMVWGVQAQTISISTTSSTVAATSVTIGGTITGTNDVAGLTNAISARVFWGGADGGTLSTAWANSMAATTAGTNNASYSAALTGLNPNTIIYARSRAQDLTGEAWSSDSITFTTSTRAATSPDQTWREGVRTGQFANVTATYNVNAATGAITRLTTSIGTLTTSRVTTQYMSIIVTGNVPFAVSVDTVTNSAGAEIKTLKLTP
jgi:hypothetical protein